MSVSANAKALGDTVQLLCELANAVVAAPKPLTVSALSGLLPLVPQLELVAGEAGEIPAELAQLSESDAAALIAQVGSVLALNDVKAEAVVEAALQLAVAGLGLAKALKG